MIIYLDGFVFGTSVDGYAGPIAVNEGMFHSIVFNEGHLERFPPLVIGDLMQLVAVSATPLHKQRTILHLVERRE